MHSHHLERPLDRPDLYSPYLPNNNQNTLWDRLQQPSVLIPLALLLVTILYQSLHSSLSASHVRHPGELLWDFIIAVTPAKLLYALDHWLHPPLFPMPDSMLPSQSRSYIAKSDALRRILGMDNPDGLVNAVAHAGRKSISSLSSGAFTKRTTDQPPGLGNYDNSCFQNSILQGLSSLKPLPAYLASALEKTETATDNGKSSSAATLRDLLSKLTDSQNNGTTLWTPKKLKSLDTWQQQDAQEYYSKILDEIDKEVTKVTKTQYPALGLEVAGIRDDTVESQHSDDSGYQSLPTLSKSASEGKAPKNPLEGLVAQRVACIQCGYSEGLSMIPFNCITLSLGIGQGDHDLYERLDSYTDLESIEGVECAKCTLLRVQRLLNIIVTRSRDIGSPEDALREPLSRLKAVEDALEEDDFEEHTLLDKCKISKQHRVSTTKTKQMVIARPPQSLAIHINRSVFDESTGQMFKNLAAVRFPTTLDLGPWCLGSAGTSGSGVSDKLSDADGSDNTMQIAEEQWSSDPKSSMVSGDLKASKISGPIYELRAVITHQGRHENGHYVCYRKHPRQVLEAKDGNSEGPDSPVHDKAFSDQEDERHLVRAGVGEDSKWWRLSDESVWEADEDSVLAQGGVFMLFYDCVDQNSVLIPRSQEGGPVILNDKDTAEPLEWGAFQTNTRPDATEDEDQFHDTRSEAEAPGTPKKAELPDEHMTHPRQTNAPGIDEQLGSLVTSCLLPLLGEDDYVDPIIPLRRPNS
ncbi:cysteine proteinase [Xylariaceae sp. FL1651]|nr:cysteine proteinase [Xylariaceae sp. FL1651]